MLKEDTKILKSVYPEQYKELQNGKYKTLQEALNIARLKYFYPKQYKEFQRLVDEKGWTPEQALKEIQKSEQQQAAKRKKAAEK